MKIDLVIELGDSVRFDWQSPNMQQFKIDILDGPSLD